MTTIIGPKVEKPSDRAWWKSASVYQSEHYWTSARPYADIQSIPYVGKRMTVQSEDKLTIEASFADHASNGHGTLQGILSKVPYLHKLGVDVVWLSPMYESPQADMGYDISNYQEVDPRYGNLDDWEQIKDACHERGMKLVMDLVVNHSSDQVSLAYSRMLHADPFQHAWFKESRSSKDSAKRDWYIWHDGKTNDQGEKIPPNNWRSTFGT
jgi:glycosidase